MIVANPLSPYTTYLYRGWGCNWYKFVKACKNSRAVKIASKSGCPEDNHFSKYSCPHIWLSSHQECWLPGNIIKCLVYFVVPMNAAVHVMCFYYSSWTDKIYANIKISKVGKTWLSACTPVYSFSVVRTADQGWDLLQAIYYDYYYYYFEILILLLLLQLHYF